MSATDHVNLSQEHQVLSIDNLCYRTEGRTIVEGVSFHVDKGEVLGLVGPSGAGKTTILRCISGLLAHQCGRILILGHDQAGISVAKRPLAFMQQGSPLYSSLTVKDNVLIPERRRLSPERVKFAEELLRFVGIKQSQLDSGPENLSGGEAQRVALCKALLKDVPLILLDEPFSNLDKRRRRDISDFIRDRVNERKVGIIFVSHDENDIAFLADRICIFNAGHVTQVGTLIELRERPINERVASFGNEAGLQSIQISELKEDIAVSLLTHYKRLTPNHLIAWRPDKSRLCDRSPLSSRESHVRFDACVWRTFPVTGGVYLQLEIELPKRNRRIWHFQPSDEKIQEGQASSVSLTIPYSDIFFLDGSGEIVQ